MTGNIVARRYARALFALGKQTGLPELEAYSVSLANICGAVAASPDLAQVFGNPIFTVVETTGVVKKLSKKLKLNNAVGNFCLLLAEKGRLGFLEAIAKVYNSLLDAEKGIIRGELITAVSLDDAKKAAVVETLSKQAKKTLVLDFGVSPEILGGVVLKVGDQVLDASIRAQLSILKDTIKRGE